MSGCSDAALWPSRRGLRAARLSPGAPREEGEEFLRLPLAIFSIELGQGRCSPRLSGRDGLQTLQMCRWLQSCEVALTPCPGTAPTPSISTLAALESR